MKKNRRVFFGLMVVVLSIQGSSVYAAETLDHVHIQVDPPLECGASGTQSVKPSPLGKNLAAHLGSWASSGLIVGMGSFLTYKSFEHIFDVGLSYIPFLRFYRQETAKIAALIGTLPVSIIALMNYGSLSNHFFYILYSGERISPLLARDALHDVRVYVEHLQTVKNVQKELNEVIDKINELSVQKKNNVLSDLNAEIVVTLNQTIRDNDAYIQAVIAQLQLFLPQEEINEYIQASVCSYTPNPKGYCVAPELEGQTQAIIAQLQSTVQSLGDDAIVLNRLMTGLVNYWQNYTAALAQGIDTALQFCNQVYGLEQIITKWLNRPLLCA